MSPWKPPLLAFALAAACPALAAGADLDALRAHADSTLAAFAATLPASERPSPALADAYREAYVATVTRTIEPCLAPGHDDPAHAAPLLLEPPGALAAVPDTDTVAVWGKVFLDLDADSLYDPGEPGLENIEVSNGTAAGPLGMGVVLTAANGTFSFLTPLPNSRFVFVTVPSGYSATSRFFHRLSAEVNPDTVYFGLRETPETANPIFRWVQISDPHVSADPPSGVELSTDLTAIETLPAPPNFIVITGDQVFTGSIDEQWQVFLSGIAGHTTRLHIGYGDHDASGAPLQVANFERYIGPTCYSFEYGGIHFVMYNDIHAVDAAGLFVQFPWLFQDLTKARARDFPNHNIPIVICKHTMPLAQEINLYNGLAGVVGAFSGHWHGSRVRLLEGIFDVNTPPSRFGGIDKSSRGFRINDMDHGVIRTEYRLAGIDDRIHLVLPADGDTVLVGPAVPIRVNGYDSREHIVSGTFRIAGPVSTGDLPLAADGPWAWKATWDATGAPDSTYTLTATLTPQVGPPFSHSVGFRLLRGGFTAAPDPNTDWPCYKHDPAGTGYTPEDLPPPLRIAWVKHLGGRNNVESPAVAAGRVYVGTSNISTVNEAALNCFDAVTGSLLWRVLARTDVKSTPAVADGRVFFTNSIGTLFALDATTGAVLWTAQLGDSLTRWEMTSPTVYDGRVYAGGIPAMTAVDAATGAILWQRVGASGPDADFIPSIYSAAAVNQNVAVFTNKGSIFALDRVSGDSLWAFIGGSRQHRSAAISGGLVYTAGGFFGSQKLVAYNLNNGQSVHLAPFPQSESTSAPVLSPDRVIIAHGGNAPGNGLMEGFQYDLTNNVWNHSVAAAIASSRPYQRETGSINSTPAIAGSFVYFGADDGRLRALDEATGDSLWSFDFGVPVRSSPAIAGNMLFVTAEDGSLYAFVSTSLTTVAAGSPGAAPLVTRLLGARPNPFNPSTTIAFDLGPTAAPVSLRIFDSQGRAVRHLIDARLEPGHHTTTWDGRNDRRLPAASGVYFYTLEAGAQTFTARLVMVR